MGNSGVGSDAGRAAVALYNQGHRATRERVNDLEFHKVVLAHCDAAGDYRWVSQGMVRETIRRLVMLTDLETPIDPDQR